MLQSMGLQRVDWVTELNWTVLINFPSGWSVLYVERHSYVCSVNIYYFYIFFFGWSLDHCLLSFLALVMFFILKPIFFWDESCYSNFLLISICVEYHFPPPHFQSVCVPGSEMGSYKQHICRSCFCIHSGSLCLLVEVFNLLTFKVVIKRKLE